jgi:hypothetical protein
MIRSLLVPCLAAIAVSAVASEGGPDMAAMATMSTTGAEHAALAHLVGNWSVASTMWMAPGAPPATSTATATGTSILDGKWIRLTYSGDWMGQPYHGEGVYGYDTMAKEHVSTWIDGATTGMTVLRGSADAQGVITYSSAMPYCPMERKPLAMRHVMHIESADRLTYTMYKTPEGGTESKGMELVYTRVP